ncbi:MAG: type I-F CRISPR-associated protein Csy2 [Pseudoxanthomonas suwonensis]|nr:type I-F CRISPR-associated protein Csy2 [Pseudoxanthomonas suwonensis]
MSRCPSYTHLLVLPRLRVQNANAISSPLTHGFPAMTAFIGFMWALQRNLHQMEVTDIRFKAIGVVSHDHQELVNDSGYVDSFRLTRNPVGKDGKTAAIVEEGRIHLEVSLILAVDGRSLGQDAGRDAELSARIGEWVQTMRIAGGTLLPSPRNGRPHLIAMTGDAEGRQHNFCAARMKLLPGFALVARDDLLAGTLEQLRDTQPDATVLDAWLHRSRRNHRYDEAEGKWVHDREKGSGWVVPIPVGYAGLTVLQAAGSVANARDSGTRFRFVESLYSLGQWISPHRIEHPEQLLWYPDNDADTYRCRNDFVVPQSSADFDWQS